MITHHTINSQYLIVGYKIKADKAIIDIISIPHFISKLEYFFLQAKLKKRKSFSKLYFIHTANLNNIIDNLKEEL